jgi:hypothetical protein
VISSNRIHDGKYPEIFSYIIEQVHILINGAKRGHMYYDFKVKNPDAKGKIYERTIKGVVYINYEYDRIYKLDKKYTIPKRTTIGKKFEDDPDMMFPNPNFLNYFPDAELPDD